MKALLLQVGIALLVALLVSCGSGYAISSAGGVGAVTALRDIGIIILAIFYLLTAAIIGGIYFGLAWAVGRFSGKAVFGAGWVARKVFQAEDLVAAGVDRGAVRPVARTARYLTTTKEFVATTLRGGDRAAAMSRGRDAAVRTVTSLARQLRGSAAVAARGATRGAGGAGAAGPVLME
jgi:hypothetical protein